MAAWLKFPRRSKGVTHLRGKVVWRIGWKPDVWVFSDWKHAKGGRFDGRWDSPDGKFRTLYASPDVYGCALEVLAHFRPDPEVARALVGIETSDSDVRTVAPGRVPSEWLMSRYLGRAQLDGRFLRVTESSVLARLRELLHRDIDASDLKSASQRPLTQAVAATVRDSFDVDGIEYASRYGDDVRLYALFERDSDGEHSALVRNAVSRDISVSHDLGRAMDTLGLEWDDFENETLPPPMVDDTPDTAVLMACFPPDGIPQNNTPLGAAYLWRNALQDNDFPALAALTWCISAWDLDEARRLVAGHNLKQRVEHPAEDGRTRDDIAYVALVTLPGGLVRDAAFLQPDEVVWLTLVRKETVWVVWGIGEERPFPEQMRRLG